MDTSETNIKMCEKAREIQDLFGWQSDNMIAWHIPYLNKWHSEIVGNYYIDKKMKDFIWLPRQDQLQEMVGINPLDLDRFRNFIGDMENNHRDSWNTGVWLSWERLWLAFVMKERYSKLWNGEEWIKS